MQSLRTRKPAAVRAILPPCLRWALSVSIWGALCLAEGRGAAAASELEPPPAALVQTPDVEEHVNRAAAMYRAGDFVEAANELGVAYTMQPQPIYLFNIAQAYRKALQARRAIAMYQRFIDVAPSNSLAIDAQGHIQDMEALARAEEAAAEANRQLAELRLRDKPLYRRAWFWGILGGVVGAAAIGVGLGIGLSRREPAPTVISASLGF